MEQKQPEEIKRPRIWTSLGFVTPTQAPSHEDVRPRFMVLSDAIGCFSLDLIWIIHEFCGCEVLFPNPLLRVVREELGEATEVIRKDTTVEPPFETTFDWRRTWILSYRAAIRLQYGMNWKTPHKRWIVSGSGLGLAEHDPQHLKDEFNARLKVWKVGEDPKLNVVREMFDRVREYRIKLGYDIPPV
jgi:hypothetical protein